MLRSGPCIQSRGFAGVDLAACKVRCGGHLGGDRQNVLGEVAPGYGWRDVLRLDGDDLDPNGGVVIGVKRFSTSPTQLFSTGAPLGAWGGLCNIRGSCHRARSGPARAAALDGHVQTGHAAFHRQITESLRRAIFDN